jgi:hypothetical protein
VDGRLTHASRQVRSEESKEVKMAHRKVSIPTLTGVAILLSLTGCASALPSACPAIGWVNTLTVALEGETATVETVQLCTENECASAAERDGDSWTFSTDMMAPDQVTVRTLAADRQINSETDVEPDWERVGGSERCGGPAAAVVTVTVSP